MFPDPQNSLNQFEEVVNPPTNQQSFPLNKQDEEDDLPLMEDLGIGKYFLSYIRFGFFFGVNILFCNLNK